MYKKALVLLIVFMLAATFLTGCGSSQNTSESASDRMPLKEIPSNNNSAKLSYGDSGSNLDQTVDTEKDRNVNEKMGSVQEVKAGTNESQTKNETTAITGSSAATQSVSNEILAQRKIIRNANVSIEVDDFEKAYGRLKSIINAFGFIQESNIRKDEKVYVNSKEKLITKGTIIIRVDKDRFESILSDIKGLGSLVNENIKSDDVTDKFFDTESRLRLLKFEQSRLEEYLKKINDPDIIFKTESRLTDIRHEIESLTGTLNKWKDLVELSTITVDMSEKVPTEAVKEATYMSKLLGNFTGSLSGIVGFCSDLLLLLANLIPGIVFAGILIILAVFIFKKFIKGRIKTEKNSKTESQEE